MVGDAGRLEGVMGNVMANSFGECLEGDFDGDLKDDLIKDEGDGGVARIAAEAGDLGDEDARRRVRVEGLVATGRGGRVAIGICGTGAVSL